LKAKYSNFAEHQRICGCEVVQDECSLLINKPIRENYPRLICEALEIEKRIEKKGSTSVISAPSIAPTKWERIIVNRNL